MNLGQSILAAAALVLITILVISANRMIILSQQDEYISIAKNAAGEIANEIINEALSKRYDKTTFSYYPDSTEFTSPSLLKPEWSEPKFTVSSPDTSFSSSLPSFRSTTSYNDFDDYNGYVRKVNTPTIKGFIAICTVTYTQPENLNVASSDYGYFKRIVVTVEQPTYLPRIPDPVTGTPQISFSAVKTY